MYTIIALTAQSDTSNFPR